MNKLAFSKAAVTELNGTQLSQINGGTGNSSNQCLYDMTSRIDTDMIPQQYV